MEDEMFYVLTNQKKMQGAVVLFYDGLLEQVAEKMNSNIIILPSSVQEEVLSNYVYRYGRGIKKLEIAA